MKSKKNLWILLASLFGLITVIFSIMSPGKKSASKATYAEGRVETGNFVASVIATGTVSPENRLGIKPPVGGRVDSILVQEGQRVSKGQILAWISTTERAALLDSARAEGAKELEQWERFYKPTPIYAPIRGMIILRALEPGQSFNANDTILVMSDRLTIKAQVDETSIAKISLNQKAEIILDAYPNEKLEGTAVHRGFDSRTVNNVTSYIVDVLPKKAPEYMLSGMTANVSFILREIPDALLIPNEALLTQEGKACVKKKVSKDPEGSPCVPVKTGLSNDQKTVIEEGLAAGDAIWVQELRPMEFKGGPPRNPFSPMGGGRGRHP
jgi:macrolide-specific efflux system membrane fusion protein